MAKQIRKPPKPIRFGRPGDAHDMGKEFKVDFAEMKDMSAKYIRLEVDKEATVHIWVSGEKVTLPWALPANQIITITEFTDKILVETDSVASIKLFASFVPPADSGTGAYATYDVPGGIS